MRRRDGLVLEHGPRVRLFWAALAAVFGAFLALGLWAQRTEAIASFWFMLGYVVMFGGAFALSASMLIAVALTWVRVDHRGIAEPRLVGGRVQIGWPGRLREALQRHAAAVAPPAVLGLLPKMPPEAS